MTEGPPERRRNPNSVAAKLENSPGYPRPVTTADIAREMMGLGQNPQGFRALGIALLGWETRFDGERGSRLPKAAPRTSNDIKLDVLAMLDESAGHADALVIARERGDEGLVYEVLEEVGDDHVGPMRSYYREISGYDPTLPPSSPFLGAPKSSPRW